MHTPKVSVVITCYKYAHYLPFAMDSALGQTYGNVEVIVVNDGSPDNTDEVMQGYLADSRVVYIKQDNAGQAVSKNVGIKAATGELIAFLDADDVWHPQKLEKQVPLFEDPATAIVYTKMRFIDEQGNSMLFETSELSIPRAGKITEYLFIDNIVPFSAAIVRKECFDKVGMMDISLRMAIDWDLWLRMSVHYLFDFVNEPLLLYRLGHPGQMSKNIFVREKDTMKIMKKFLAENPDLLPRRLVRWVMAYSYCNRGYQYRPVSIAKSLGYYLGAIKWRWNHVSAYYGILKTIGYSVLTPLGWRKHA